MKKSILCFILLIVFLFIFVVANADLEANYFPTTLLNALDYNAKEWMSTESNRAMFAACALLDYDIKDDTYDISNLYMGTTYVGRAAFVVMVGFNSYNNDKSILILFDTTDSNQAAFTIMPVNKVSLNDAMELVCNDGYYKVDPVDIKAVNDMLLEMLQSS